MTPVLVAAVVVFGILSVVSIICATVLYGCGKLGWKESRSVRAARDNLTRARINAEEDLVRLAHDRILDVHTHKQGQLEAGDVAVEADIIRGKIGTVPPPKKDGPLKGVVYDPHQQWR